MFPLQSQDGLQLFEDSLFGDQDNNLLDDLLADYAALEANQVADQGVVVEKRQTQTSPSGIQENKDIGSSKKTMHRDIERQRRQEMAGLYASLRSLLPLEYVKGRRAISDHMHQAVNYIKHMQKNMEEMQMKRDKLRSLSNAVLGDGAVVAENPSSSVSDSSRCVKVHLCSNGMEILISISINKSSLLSKVLTDLLRRGFDVISCVSTRADKCVLHKIQIELNDPTSIDLAKLQKSLVNVIGCA